MRSKLILAICALVHALGVPGRRHGRWGRAAPVHDPLRAARTAARTPGDGPEGAARRAVAQGEPPRGL